MAKDPLYICELIIGSIVNFNKIMCDEDKKPMQLNEKYAAFAQLMMIKRKLEHMYCNYFISHIVHLILSLSRCLDEIILVQEFH